MKNAKLEFLKEIEGRVVKCAQINGGEWRDTFDRAILKIGYSQSEFENFLDSIDTPYDNGFGGQELFGFIWYADGTWSERGEYDGSEWWEHKVCPTIPEDMKLDGLS